MTKFLVHLYFSKGVQVLSIIYFGVFSKINSIASSNSFVYFFKNTRAFTSSSSYSGVRDPIIAVETFLLYNAQAKLNKMYNF